MLVQKVEVLRLLRPRFAFDLYVNSIVASDIQ